MYGKAGVAYIYFTYGMHWLLNVVTGGEGDPQAVLIRAIRPIDGQANRNTDGPAKLTKSLEITGNLNKEDLVKSFALWFEDSQIVGKIEVTPRIGVDYAQEWKDKPLRFILKIMKS